jgi:hypothetical protein
MCFSFEVSLATGLFSWSVGLFLLNNRKLTKRQRQDVIFLLIFSSMQFADAILWYIEMEKNDINFTVTSYVIPTILAMQGIYNIFIRKAINSIYFNIFTFVCVIYLFYRFHGYSSPMCSNKLSSPIWGSKELKLWEIALFTFYAFYPDALNITAIIILTLLIKGAFGSMWCAIGNLIAIKYLIYYG